jgi:hypothetical protein
MRIIILVIGVTIGLAATYLLKDLDTQLSRERAATDSLRDRARGVTAAMADLRAAQFACVAQGQGREFWVTQVENILPAVQNHLGAFSDLLTAAAARDAFEPANAAVENFRTLHGRVRDYVTSGNSLLASDLIFSDGLESTSTVSTQVASALNEELQARDRNSSAMRGRQAVVAAGAAVSLLLLMALLVFAADAAKETVEAQPAAPPVEPPRFEAPLPRAKPAITPKLINTAHLCSELARVNDSAQLRPLLERTARIIDASGVIVWVADPTGRELRPAVAHGYTDQVVRKLGAIHRDSNNAAAAAYRTGEVRAVAGDAATPGAMVVPLWTSDGCIGVLSAEMKGGSEKDESSQALASIFAAQLATIVSPPEAAPAKAAAQG